MDDMKSGGEQEIGNYERGIETMQRLWGVKRTEELRDLWRKAHPEAERYITGFALGEVWSRGVLDLKTRSLISLAAAVALERDGQIRLHTRGAIHSGATREEVLETVLHLMVYASFPAAWQALLAVQEAIDEEAASDEV